MPLLFSLPSFPFASASNMGASLIAALSSCSCSSPKNQPQRRLAVKLTVLRVSLWIACNAHTFLA